MRLAWGLVAAALLASPRAATAQRLDGAVRDAVTGEGIAGAVVSTHATDGSLVARSLSGTSGRFTLARPAAGELRVVRLGYRPYRQALPSGADTARGVEVALQRVPALLGEVAVVESAVCPRDGESRAAASLWEQARAALLASVVAREARPAVATNLVFERTSARDGAVIRQTARRTSGRTTRPFLTPRTPAELARSGYLDGGSTSGTVTVPDADVLLDESFAATHCFALRRGPDPNVGLTFAPAARRDSVVDVRGTLWLNSRVPTLDSLEFRYTGMTRAAERAEPGGIVRFRTLTNGVVVVGDWRVRLPVLEERHVPRPGSVRVGAGTDVGGGRRDSIEYRVLQYHETGGVLERARWPDSVEWVAPRATLRGRVLEKGGTAPLAGVQVGMIGVSDTATTGPDGRFVLSTPVAGPLIVQAWDTTNAFLADTRTVSRPVALALGDTTTTDFALPSMAQLAGAACLDDRRAANVDSTARMARAGVTLVPMIGRVTLPGGASVRALTVTARWQADYLFARDQQGGVVVKEDGGEATLSADGRFHFCDVVLARNVLLQLGIGGARLADTVIVIAEHESLAVVDWRPAVTAATIARSAPSVFRGVVRAADDGRPLPGVDVWLPTHGLRVVTDSAGAFRFDHVPGGPLLLQARRIGYAVQRDTLTLQAGTETVRALSLLALGRMLDTVRTVASATRYGSPALRAFEARRAAGDGRFVSDSMLRSAETRPLGNVLLSHIPGLTTVPAPGGGAYLVSTRKSCSGNVLVGPCTPCFVTVYLDGMLLYSGGDDAHPGGSARPFDVNQLQTSDVTGVEFYADGASRPASLTGGGPGCGTLALWTRER